MNSWDIDIDIEKEKEKILVHTIHVDDGLCFYGEFFSINTRNREITKSPHALFYDQGANSMMCVGSTVYVLGGHKPGIFPFNVNPPDSIKGIFHTGMSFLDLNDLNKDDDGWKQGPCLHNAPSNSPSVTSLGGKIYLFREVSYAGIFDPVDNTWETLLPPPELGYFNVRSNTCSAVSDPFNNRVLVHFWNLGGYFAYYPSEKRWQRDLDSLPWSPKQVFISKGVLYNYLTKDPLVFQAFDLATKHYLDIVFTSKVRGRVWRMEFDFLFYLGNDHLCLLTHTPNYTSSSHRTNVLIAKFRVQRTVDHPHQLLLTPFPLETYTIDASCASDPSYLPI